MEREVSDLVCRYEPERYEIVEAPDEIDVSLQLLIEHAPKAIRMEYGLLKFGYPDEVAYQIEFFDHTMQLFHCRKWAS